ncbi:hypothetical protein A8F94_20075 [Bacillus sp. FJAT-27225]|uniref:hypothetical protein n=1 Tax=Bacillus sp. FJAT-27225 TaxID=1743144 RepID=UPI00080C2537|nr:hypothetical protein [Bacillus sp. FJAT-27225]OCA82214.1 hypothetical protein A8F94_20075 [Bacillus sp. FJAT-27225]
MSSKAIERAIKKLIKRIKNGSLENLQDINIDKILNNIADEYKEDVLGQIIDHEYNYKRSKGIALSSLVSSKGKEFESDWSSINYRLSVIPGKDAFSKLNKFLQKEWKISISHQQVLQNLTKREIDEEIVGIFLALEQFLERNVSASF